MYLINIAQEDFRRYLKVLLYRGHDMAFMVIEAPDNQRFIQFSRYIDKEDGPGLQFDFPHAPWSEEYFAPLRALVDQRNYKYEIEPVNPSPKSGNQVSEFLMIDLGGDLDKAAELSELMFLEIFKLKPSETVTLWFDNVSLDDDEDIGL